MTRTQSILFTAALATAFVVIPSSIEAASYAKYATITVSGVPDNTTLTDFPLLVRISALQPSGFSYNDFMQQDYSDLRFEDANGNGLAYDVDTWNTTGESLVWIKVPSLVKDAEITMRWGSAAPDTNDATNVWSNYVFVWHGNGSGTGQDATGKTRTITPAGSGFALSQDEAAFLGSCFKNESTANNKKVTVTTNPFSELASYSQFAISGWIKPAMTEPTIRIFSTKEEHSKDGMEFLAVKDQGIFLRGKAGSAGNKQIKWPTGYQELKKQAWTYVAGVIDGTSGVAFANGLTETTSNLLAPESAGNGFAICGYAGADFTGSTQGCIDEIRLYNGVPSDAYLTAEYAQVVSNDYTTIGAAQTADAGAADIPDAPMVVRNQDGTYTISATFLGTAGETYDYAFQLNGAECGTGSVTLGALETEKTISWTTDGNVVDGTYLASVTVTKGTSTALRSAATTFLVGDLGFGVCTNAYEEGLVSGAFVLTRPGDATQPLTVAYTVSSATATAGTSYETFSGMATFAAGELSVAIPVVPLNDSSLTADATLTLTLSAGLYGIAVGSESAAITLVNWATPAGYNVWIASSGSDGLASTAANWSAGRAPIATDAILLGAWGNANMTWDADATHTVASWTQTDGYTGHVEFPITYEGADVDAGFNLFRVSGDVELRGGYWQHPVQGATEGSDATNERYRLAISVGGDFAVSNGVTISGQARGKYSWTNYGGWSGYAMHGGYVISDDIYATSNSMVAAYPPYGSILAPVNVGRGAAGGTDQAERFGYGGGAVWFDIGGDFIHDGRITVNGQGSTSMAGGSAGSIYIHAANISFGSKATVDANGTAGTKTDGASAAGSGGRIALIADDALDVELSQVNCAGSKSGNQYAIATTNKYTGAAGTEWLKSSSSARLVVRNAAVDGSTQSTYGKYFKAYTPIPADDDAATFKAEAKEAELYAASNARIRLERNVEFASLKVWTGNASLAHIDLYGHTLKVGSVVDSSGNELVTKGVYTLADAQANGWTWFEDSVGGGELVVGRRGFTVIVR